MKAISFLFPAEARGSHSVRNGEQAQLRNVGDDHECGQEYEKKGERSPIELQNRALEAGTGDEQVQAHRGGGVADLQIDEEDDTEVNRVDPIGGGDRQHQRHHDDEGGEHVDHATDNQQKDIEENQELKAVYPELF